MARHRRATDWAQPVQHCKQSIPSLLKNVPGAPSLSGYPGVVGCRAAAEQARDRAAAAATAATSAAARSAA